MVGKYPVPLTTSIVADGCSSAPVPPPMMSGHIQFAIKFRPFFLFPSPSKKINRNKNENILEALMKCLIQIFKSWFKYFDGARYGNYLENRNTYVVYFFSINSKWFIYFYILRNRPRGEEGVTKNEKMLTQAERGLALAKNNFKEKPKKSEIYNFVFFN